MNKILSEEVLHFVKGLDPVADAFDGTVYSDVVDARNYGTTHFIVFKGVGTTGTSTITVQACDDIVPTTRSAVAFRSRRCANSADTAGALTARTSAGFDTTAGSSELYVIEVDNTALAAAGYGYVQLKMVEVVNSPVVGCILVAMGNARYPSASQESAID